MQTTSEKQQQFLRPVSGLVRNMGAFDTFVYNIGLISIGIGLLYTQRYANSYYPDGSISLSTVFAAILMLFAVAGLLAWTTAVPRSGGVYVFLSRAGFPGFGFAASFVETISWIFYAGIAAQLSVTTVFHPLAFLSLGDTHFLTLFLGTTGGQFVLGGLLVAAGAMLLIRGTRLFLKVQLGTFAVAVVGSIALILVLSGGGEASSTLERNLSPLLAEQPQPQAAISLAVAEGWVSPGTKNIRGSFILLVWPFLPLIGAAFSIAVGGEVRNSVRNQSLGMLGSLVVATVAFVLVAELAAGSIGDPLQGALGFLDDAKLLGLGGEQASLAPTIALLTALATDSLFLRFLIFLGFLAWTWFWVVGLMSYGQRAVLAWSLDRVVPGTFGRLHSRYGTPYVAILSVAAATLIFLALITWTEYFATLVFILAGAVAWGLALFFGIFFPFARRGLFDRTPLGAYGARGRFAMAFACLGGTIALGVVGYLLANDEIAAGDLTKGFTIIGVCFGLGLGIFYTRLWQLSQLGINLRRSFEEIPVE